jgi:hypothetical protein
MSLLRSQMKMLGLDLFQKEVPEHLQYVCFTTSVDDGLRLHFSASVSVRAIKFVVYHSLTLDRRSTD